MKLSYDEYIEKNYKPLREAYEELLEEAGYNPLLLDQVDDWREEVKQEEYNLYLNDQI